MKNRFTLRNLIVSSVVALLCLLTSAQLALAEGGVGGYPLNPLDATNKSWFMYNLGLGESYNDILVVKNDSTKEWLVDIYPADSMPSSGGGFALKQKSEKMSEMGTWIKLSKSEVFLKPGESTQIPFTITIPSDANIGETAGAILFERRDPVTSKAAVDKQEGGIKLSIRTGARIYNTVPGEIIQKLTLKDFDISFKQKDNGTKYYLIHTNTENAGNVSTNVKYAFTITNTLNGEELKKEENQFLILRDTTFENNYELADFPKFGKLAVKLSAYIQLKDGSEKLLESREASIWVIPYTEIFLTLLALAAVAGYFFWNKKRYSGKGWVKYSVKAGENIMGVAAKHAIDWKLLAKTNRLKSPYTLAKGMEILVPGKGKKK
jgi:hypothetical protein